MATTVARNAYGVGEFCEAHSFSRAFFYKLLKQGKGPKTFKVGSRTFVSATAAAEWRETRESLPGIQS